jgi:hypothetical protein
MRCIILKDKYDDLLNELVILQKMYLLYSHGHMFLEQSAISLLKILNELHKTTPKIRIAGLGKSLLINNMEYGNDNPKVGYLSQLLGGRGIFSISFNLGVELGSILDFFYLLNAIPNKSNLLYHRDIQIAMHNIDSIEIEEMDYSGIRYSYEDEGQNHSTDIVLNKNQLYEILKSLNSAMDSFKKNELIDIAMEEINKMSPDEVSDFIAGLSDEAVSEILKIVKAKETSISPLLDRLVVLDASRRLAANGKVAEFSDRRSNDQLNKLIEGEAYELYVSEKYKQHLGNISEYDSQSLDKFNMTDLFDKVLISKTVVIALIHLIKNELDPGMHDRFVESIYNYIDEFLESGDWYFICSILNNELVCTYLEQDSTVRKLSEGIINNKSYSNNHIFEVLKVSGPKNLNWLMDLYIDESEAENRSSILSLILLFSEAASVEAINKIISYPTQNVSLLVPIIENNLKAIPRVLLLQLLSSDLANVKLLAIKILLTRNDYQVKDEIEQIILDGEDDLVIGVLDLIRDYKITKYTEALIGRIRTLYISKDHLKITLKTIDTVASIDDSGFQNLAKQLMRKRFTLSPRNLRIIKQHLKGVSHGKRFR